MLQKSTLDFLLQLEQNNHRDWFEANRKKYESAKNDFLQLTGSILEQFSKKDTTLSSLEPKNCTFRINRDVRFSKDKSPYKTNMGAAFSKGGKKAFLAGYYLHCQPGQSFIAGGIWMPMAPELKKIRQEIDYCFSEFESIIHNQSFESIFGNLENGGDASLSRPPKGYSDDNPAIAFLKLKSITASCKINDEVLLSSEAVATIVNAFSALQPLVHFLNRALEA